MDGILFNILMLLISIVIGRLLAENLTETFKNFLNQTLTLIVLTIGIGITAQNMSQVKTPIIFIVSLILGGLFGTVINVENILNNLVKKIGFQSNLTDGIATSTAILCTGSLAILGPINIVINHDYTFIITNTVLDSITGVLLSSIYGWAILIPLTILFVIQTIIYVVTLLFKGGFTPEMIYNISLIGGIMLLASGSELVGAKKFTTLNFLPALIIAPIICLIWY